MTVDDYHRTVSCDINRFFSVSFETVVTDKLEFLVVTDVQKYVPNFHKSTDGQAVSRNTLPIIHKELNTCQRRKENNEKRRKENDRNAGIITAGLLIVS